VGIEPIILTRNKHLNWYKIGQQYNMHINTGGRARNIADELSKLYTNEEEKISSRSIRRYSDFAKSVDKLAEALGKEIKEDILCKIKPTQNKIKELAKVLAESGIEKTKYELDKLRNNPKQSREESDPYEGSVRTINLEGDTNLESEKLIYWLRNIDRKKQAIFYGSPGTGKTFIAEKIAQHLINSSDGFTELVQFHPAYSYEDFIQGIRPQSQNGQLTYPLVPGRFLEFCKKAESRRGLCVLIIDEINRANLASVFGELMYLLEYRNKKIRLAGSNELFCIPENVRIIGTMNTADRSIALVDRALRRRFAFIELRPNYDVLRRYHEKKTGFSVDDLIKVMKQLNHAIADKHYELGISYFLTENIAEDIGDIWCMEIEPYLEEYFFDQPEKVDEFRWDKIVQQVTPISEDS
jgi:5-methylcytosine-specific restriction protein B